MKYILVLIVSVGPLVRKCAQEGSELAAQRAGSKMSQQGSKAAIRNTDDIIARVAARSTILVNRELQKKNQYVTYVDSTNTFIVDNVNTSK
jgi:hypothetical protein